MKYGTEATKVVKRFNSYFSTFGLPDIVVTDNGPPFNSQYFIGFLERQGIQVLKSPPYHPQSNGQAERLVRVTKDVLKKFMLDPKTKHLDMEDMLSYFLFNYRNTCLSDGDKYPSEKVLSYRPKTLIDLMNPRKTCKQLATQNTDFNVTDQNKENVDVSVTKDKFATLTAGDKVYYKNPNSKDIPKWIEAVFIKRISQNILQIAIGAHIISAHKGQVNLPRKAGLRRNVTFRMGGQDCQEPTTSTGRNSGVEDVQDSRAVSGQNSHVVLDRDRGTKRKHDSIDDEDLFMGFPSHEFVPPPSKCEVHPTVLLSNEGMQSKSELRRSKRIKRKVSNEDYVYFK